MADLLTSVDPAHVARAPAGHQVGTDAHHVVFASAGRDVSADVARVGVSQAGHFRPVTSDRRLVVGDG